MTDQVDPEPFCGKAAEFVVAVHGEDVESAACVEHLPEAVRAAYVDFDANADVRVIGGRSCEMPAGSYAQVITARVAQLRMAAEQDAASAR